MACVGRNVDEKRLLVPWVHGKVDLDAKDSSIFNGRVTRV